MFGTFMLVPSIPQKGKLTAHLMSNIAQDSVQHAVGLLADGLAEWVAGADL